MRGKGVKAGAAITAPPAGWRVRFIGAPDLRESRTVATLNALGGTVVSRGMRNVTHLVTMDAPIAPGRPNDGTLTARQFNDYVIARTAADEIGAKTLSFAEFRELVNETDKKSWQPAGGAMPGFIGI